MGNLTRHRKCLNFRIVADAKDSLEKLKKAGFELIIVTNQPDVATGKTAKAFVDEIHKKLLEILPIDSIQTCFHGQKMKITALAENPNLECS